MGATGLFKDNGKEWKKYEPAAKLDVERYDILSSRRLNPDLLCLRETTSSLLGWVDSYPY